MDFASAETARQWLAGKINKNEVRRSGNALYSGDRLVRSLGANEATAGATTYSTGFVDTLIAAREAGNVVARETTTLPTDTGSPIKVPITNDVANAGEMIAENEERTPVDFFISSAQLDAYTVDARVIVSKEFLEDATPEVIRVIGKLLGERIGRAANVPLTTGNGTDEPQGIVTGASVAKTVAADDAVTYADLVDAMAALGDAYHENASWMMNRATLTAILKVVDGAQRPVFNIDKGTLFGRPCVVNSAMPSMTADAKPILYGALAGFACRMLKDVTINRDQESRADYGQVVLSSVDRIGSRYLDTSAVVALRMAGS